MSVANTTVTPSGTRVLNPVLVHSMQSLLIVHQKVRMIFYIQRRD